MSETSQVKLPFPMTLTLASPVTYDGQTITAISFRSPKGRDWKRWGQEPEGPKRTMGLLCDLAQQPEGLFDELDYADHAKAVQAAESFFGLYQPEETGFVKALLASPSVSAGLLEQLKGST